MKHLTSGPPWANLHYLHWNDQRCPYLGFWSITYSINAYVVNEDGSISVWLQRRVMTKSKFPGKLDSFVSSAGQDT